MFNYSQYIRKNFPLRKTCNWVAPWSKKFEGQKHEKKLTFRKSESKVVVLEFEVQYICYSIRNSHLFSSVSIVHFDKVNVSWVLFSYSNLQATESYDVFFLVTCLFTFSAHWKQCLLTQFYKLQLRESYVAR